MRRLHETLLANTNDLREAIRSDSGHTAVEADIEFGFAVSELRTHYESLDFEELENEYSIAKGKDNAERRVGAGIVYIVPTSYSLLYSTIATLSAAVAAGNCVIVEVNI